MQLYGSRRGDKRFFSRSSTGLEYDNLFIFDEVGWNFEPSELSAAFGLVQLRKLPHVPRTPQAQLRAAVASTSRSSPDVFVLPRTLDGLDTGWHMFPILIRPESGIRRADVPAAHGDATASTPAWCGRATRCANPRSRACRIGSPRRLPNADRVMEQGLVLPSNHGLTDDDVDYICETLDAYLRQAKP